MNDAVDFLPIDFTESCCATAMFWAIGAPCGCALPRKENMVEIRSMIEDCTDI